MRGFSSVLAAYALACMVEYMIQTSFVCEYMYYGIVTRLHGLRRR